MIESEKKNSKLCGKLLHQETNGDFRLCTGFYIVSSRCKINLNWKTYPNYLLNMVAYTPYCDACKLNLTFSKVLHELSE